MNRLPATKQTVLHAVIAFLPWTLLLVMQPNPSQITGKVILAFIFVLQNAFLVYTSLRFAKALVRSADLIEIILVGALVSLCVPTVVIPGLGIFHRLTLANVLLTGALVQILLLAIIFQRPSGMRLDWHSFGEPFSLGERVLMVFTVFAFGILTFNTIRHIPTSFDDMAYHLPMVAEWIKTASIAPDPSSSVAVIGYPGGREAVVTWLSLPFASENLALLSVLEGILAFLSLYATCRLFSVPRPLSLALGALFVTTPKVAHHFLTQKNDTFVVFAFILTWYFLVRTERTGRFLYAVLAGLAGGLLCGTKFSGPGYFGLLVLTFVAIRVSKGIISKTKPLAHTLSLVVVMVLVMVLISGVWYARNILYFENPVYPAKIQVLGYTVFNGPWTMEMVNEDRLGYDFGKLLGYWGQLREDLGIMLPVLAMSPFLLGWVILSRRRNDTIALSLWLILLPISLVLLYMGQPFSLMQAGANSWHLQTRFLFPYLAVAHISFGTLLRHSPLERLSFWLILLAVIVNVSWWTHGYWVGLGLAILIALLSLSRLPTVIQASLQTIAGRPYGLVIAASTIFLLVPAVLWIENFRESQKYDPEYGYRGESTHGGWGEVSIYVYENLKAQNIWLMGERRKFPLYGKQFTNTLTRYDKEHEDRRQMILNRSLDTVTLTESDIVRFIAEHQIDYIVGFRPIKERQGPLADIYIFETAPTVEIRKKFPTLFQIVYSYQGAEVLKILRDST